MPGIAGDPRRLRIVVPRYGARVIGGTETLARRLAESLAGAGWQIEVWTSCAEDEATWANVHPPGTGCESGVSVRRFPTVRERRPFLFRQFTRAVFALPATMRPERAWIEAQGPTAPGLVAALAAEPPWPTFFSPYLYHPTLIGLPACRGPRLLLAAAHDERPLRLRAVGTMLAATGALLYGTDEERRLLEGVHPVARGLPWEIGSTGIEPPSELRPERFRSAQGIRGAYLISGGRSGRGKGIADLRAGFARLRRLRPDARLVLTGEAGAGAESDAGVIMAGNLEDAMRWDAIAGAAAVVVPSFHESLSLAALEAWAAGRPVLVNGASPVLVGQVTRSGGGIVYRGAGDLAAAAASLLDDPARAAALGSAGQEYAGRHYRWSDVHARLVRLIIAAAAKGSPA